MFQDGICRSDSNYYSKTIQFQDINYQLAQQEDKTAIFDEWCGFLNFFDSSVHFELSFMNLSTDAVSFEKSIRIPPRNDGFNDVREEYSKMLRTQLAQGNNGLTKTKYLTFGIEAESMKQAKPRLIHIQTDLLNNFRRLGVVATVLDGKQRLKVMHDLFHMGDKDRFYFEWKWLPESGLSVKDFIAPSSFSFPGGRMFQMGDLYGGFSEAAGTTPVAYLVHYRSEQAADLLLHTDRPVTEIAVLCGFFDTSYFIRTFRRFYGTSPSRYRRANRP
jgi:hypothetical protein